MEGVYSIDFPAILCTYEVPISLKYQGMHREILKWHLSVLTRSFQKYEDFLVLHCFSNPPYKSFHTFLSIDNSNSYLAHSLLHILFFYLCQSFLFMFLLIYVYCLLTYFKCFLVYCLFCLLYHSVKPFDSNTLLCYHPTALVILVRGTSLYFLYLTHLIALVLYIVIPTSSIPKIRLQNFQKRLLWNGLVKYSLIISRVEKYYFFVSPALTQPLTNRYWTLMQWVLLILDTILFFYNFAKLWLPR